jgi:hypothetical protein
MTDVAGCIMHADKKCVVRALVFARRAEVRIGINETGIGGLDHVSLTVEEAKVFHQALSRAISEANAYRQPAPTQGARDEDRRGPLGID